MFVSATTRLRSIEPDDLPNFVTWLNDPVVRDNLILYAPLSQGDEERWYEGMVKDQGKSRFVFAIDARADDETWFNIGVCGLERLDWRSRTCVLGIFLGAEHHGKGHGSAAMRLLLDSAFLELDFARVELEVIAFNEGARRLYERLGFVHEGTRRGSQFQHGERHDAHWMALLRQEWPG